MDVNEGWNGTRLCVFVHAFGDRFLEIWGFFDIGIVHSCAPTAAADRRR